MSAGIIEINLSEYKTLNELLAGYVTTGYGEGDLAEAAMFLGKICAHITVKTVCQIMALCKGTPLSFGIELRGVPQPEESIHGRELECC